MRFAYIDSQGNEVSIPSVDALALRIELGAIGPETQLYDEQADHWAPANTHEIFHTLSRAQGEEGFVAPPPPVAPPPSLSDEPAEAPPEEPEEEPAEEPAAQSEEPGAPSVFDLGDGLELEDASPEEVPEAEAPQADDRGLDMDFSLAPASTPDPDAESEPDDLGLGGDLAAPDDLDMGMTMADAPADLAAEGGEDSDDGAFDFGDMGSLELEGPPVVDEEPEAPAGGGMELEESLGDSMDFSPGGGDSGAMELETPMSEFSADEAPAWMEPSGSDEDDSGAMGFDQPAVEESPSAAADDEAPAEREERARPEPRTRPSPPKRRKKVLGPLLMGVAAVAVVGVGGFFGWKAVSGGLGGPDSEEDIPALPAVVIPDIPAELLPTMRDLAEAALADMMAEVSGMQDQFDLQAEPSNGWLSGAYLGTASQFEDVEQYWLGLEAFVDHVRDVDTGVFHDMYLVQVEAAGIAADTAAMLVERADSGFLATRADRFEAYNQMDDLINAALDLHMFLVDNEDYITYEPAAGGLSRDPVLEAIPDTKMLGDEMWGLVDNITDALDTLGTLNRVTTERLLAVLFDRIRRAGIR